jgi:hypothetical protein
VPPKGFNQFVGCGMGNLATTLPSSDRSPELDLRQRQDGKPMSRIAGGEAKKPVRARFINVKLDEGTRF